MNSDTTSDIRSKAFRRHAGADWFAVIGGNWYGPFSSCNDATDRIPDADAILHESQMDDDILASLRP